MWLLLLWLGSAQATSVDEVQRRLDAVDSMRSMRIAKDAIDVPESEVRKAAEGSIVTGLERTDGEVARAYGVVVFDVPIGTLWSALNDETRHIGYTAVEYAEILAGKPCQNGRRVLQSVNPPFVGARWWIGVPTQNRELMRNSGGAVRELAFRSSVDPSEVTTASGQQIIESSIPIGFSEGAWFLVALDERHTWAEYYLRTDPGGRVPSRLATSFASKGVKNTIEAIRTFAREGNPSCPVD